MMEHFNGVDSEVFKEEEDVGEFEKMLEKAKEDEANEGQSMLDKLKQLFSK
jgi:hypothetical protein